MTTFIGSGDSTALGRRLPPWINSRGEQIADLRHPRHPAGYLADPGLVDAVNTALILGKPLLLTGRPGSGKSELAERIAWEFALSPVLRFEAQSLSEAQELFYRFDLVGQMADAQLAAALRQPPQPPEAFLTFGPLGKAILHANPAPYGDLLDKEHRADAALPKPAGAPAPVDPPPPARRSVVLIDEIDKAARDVPNDLLNGIERLEFRIRELRNRPVAAPDEPTLRPIVLITSNSERDLPEPFLRRCVFHHIAEPDQDKLREILRARVAGLDDRDDDDGAGVSDDDRPASRPLPPFYEALLSFFVAFRDDPGARTAYTPGTSELLDWTRVLRQLGADAQRDLADNAAWLARSLGAVVKHGDDLAVLQQAFIRLRGLDLRHPAAARPGSRAA